MTAGTTGPRADVPSDGPGPPRTPGRRTTGADPVRESRLLQIVHSIPSAPIGRPHSAVRQSARRIHNLATPEPGSTAELLPDSLTDRGNAKLFVRLYARDYRHVTGLGWYRWDST
ncbi:hypothetical protein ACTU45_05435, partial [Streptomyces sp. 24-1644]